MQDQLEVVDSAGFRYQITRLGARTFAQVIAGAKRLDNWVRCVDPAHKEHHVGEGGWQGAYHVRFIEKLDSRTNGVVDYKVIWGVPKHSMREFYEACKSDWPELPAFNTFRQAVACTGGKKMKGFSVQKQASVELTRTRCPLISLPDQPGLPVAAVAAAPQSAVASAGGAVGPQVCCEAFEPDPSHLLRTLPHGKIPLKTLKSARLRTDPRAAFPAGRRASRAA